MSNIEWIICGLGSTVLVLLSWWGIQFRCSLRHRVTEMLVAHGDAAFVFADFDLGGCVLQFLARARRALPTQKSIFRRISGSDSVKSSSVPVLISLPGESTSFFSGVRNEVSMSVIHSQCAVACSTMPLHIKFLTTASLEKAEGTELFIRACPILCFLCYLK
jgi:hypothetical protein